MTNLIWPPERDLPPADGDQERVAEVFREYGKVIVEAPPGTGKTFLGVYLAMCSSQLGWVSKKRPALFLTFSRNARVRIEREITRFQQENWIGREEIRAVKVSNYHAFYLETLRRKAGFWGCAQTLRPASISERQQRLEILLSEAGVDEAGLGNTASQAGLVFALRRFDLPDLMGFNTALLLDENLMHIVYNSATNALRDGRPHYDDFAPLFLNLLEHCPELVHWLRLVYPVVILDEFQDTDAIQWEIIRRIHPERIVVLFDRYQMIYEWRGARPDRIDQVKQEFDIPDQAEKELTHIHRVGNEANLARFIQQLRVDDLLGSAVVENNKGWLTTYPVRRWRGVSPTRWTLIPDKTKCLQTIRQGRFVEFDETTAILTRWNYLADFLYRNLRVKKKGSQYYRCRWIGSDNNPDEMIRDHIWRLRQINDNLALRAWCGRLLDELIPKQFLSNLSFESEFAREGGHILRQRKRSNLQAVRQALLPWWDMVDLGNYSAFARALRIIPDLGELVLEGDGFLDPDALYYIRELAKAVEAYSDSTHGQDWGDFCDHLEDKLVRSAFLRLRSSPRGLYILTVHQSKGREFDHVVIPWLSGRGEPCMNRVGRVFPRKYDYDEFEDRRLLYVALTRARRRVTLIYPEEDPSLFIARWQLD
jgi:superfamily I DNA/RNA helicase